MLQTHREAMAPPSTLVPLCVDLDGTLVKSDTLLDSILVLLRTHPFKALALPAQALRGKAAFKRFVTDSVELDVQHLPYNRTLLQYLREERASGRTLYLATGADERLALRIADHLGLFDQVLGSNGATNLTGKRKLDRIQATLSSEEFDYVGNDIPDLPLLRHARQPMVANPTLRLRMQVKGIQPLREFNDRSHPLRAFFKTIRVHQWAKNILIFLPLLLAHNFHVRAWLLTALAFACFSLAASATYIVNDLLDLETDRRHPRKCKRPFASGDLSAVQGLAISAIFLATALLGTRFLPVEFLGWLLLYLVSTLTYSTLLKRIPLVDVLLLSGLYTLRLLAGGAATHTPISPWMAGFSVFFFLSLAIVKRFAELQNLRSSALQPRNGLGYRLSDLEQLRSFGTASAYSAVVIFALYISSQTTNPLYHHANRLWLMLPLMIFWVSRAWLLASRGELNEDPVVWAVTDRASLLLGLVLALVIFLAL
jgi:4-hydroxybenzoate polyprenyltransferase/phosphoserine phosphatase